MFNFFRKKKLNMKECPTCKKVHNDFSLSFVLPSYDVDFNDTEKDI